MLLLLPPSEGKQSGGSQGTSQRSFGFKLPIDIATAATPKDLKCTGARYEEGIYLNTQVQQGLLLPAIQRYTGVMYSAIDYQTMTHDQQAIFDSSVLILSGMYGLLRPTDQIANYKLPITTKGLYAYRGGQITDALNELPQTQIIDLLSGSYKKMINWSALKHEVMLVEFWQYDKKLTHAVKGVKGRRLREVIKNSEERGESKEKRREKKEFEIKISEGVTVFDDEKLGEVEVRTTMIKTSSS